MTDISLFFAKICSNKADLMPADVALGMISFVNSDCFPESSDHRRTASFIPAVLDYLETISDEKYGKSFCPSVSPFKIPSKPISDPPGRQ